MSKPRYNLDSIRNDFRCHHPTIEYSAVAHTRGHLHMNRMRIDNFYILTGKGPKPEAKMLRPNVFEWTMTDQAEMVAKILADALIIEPQHPDPEIDAEVKADAREAHAFDVVALSRP